MKLAPGPLRLALLSSLAGFAALFVRSSQHAVDAAAQAALERDLGRLWGIDAKLNEDLLEARAGLVSHYDQLVQGVQQLRALHRSASAALPPGTSRQDLRRGLERAGALLLDKEQLLERFKAEHAVLRNSRQYLPQLVAALRRRLQGSAGGAELDARLVDLLQATSRLDIAAPREVHEAARASFEALSQVRVPGAGLDVELLIQHARLTLERAAEVDALVHRLLRLPFAEEVARVAVAHAGDQRAALAAAKRRERWLYALGLSCIVLALAEVIWRLRQSARALGRASEELRIANEALVEERNRERELGQLKTRFVSMTSHEFRTPLSTILSSSELLERYGERWDAERREAHLGHIRTSARHMSRMLEEILVIGRAEAGVLSPAAGVVDLHEFCTRLIETHERSSGGSHDIRLGVTGEARVWLDERLLTHVLANLLDNAIKYSAPGSQVRLDVAVRAGECELRVSDEGIGISSQDRERLFESFQRGSNVGQVAGSGLGLAVVKRVVDVQRGSIRVASEPGQGTCFVVTLPLEHREPAPGVEPSAPKIPVASEHSGK